MKTKILNLDLIFKIEVTEFDVRKFLLYNKK